MGLLVILFFTIIIASVISIISYAHKIDMDDLKNEMQSKMDAKDKYIAELIAELRSKQYEVDSLRGYKSN